MGKSTFQIRNGDLVEVITGNHKRAQGRVIQVKSKKQQVVVENVRLLCKHTRRSQRFPNGGIIKREGVIHVSNVRLVRRPEAGNRGSQPKGGGEYGH